MAQYVYTHIRNSELHTLHYCSLHKSVHKLGIGGRYLLWKLKASMTYLNCMNYALGGQKQYYYGITVLIPHPNLCANSNELVFNFL